MLHYLGFWQLLVLGVVVAFSFYGLIFRSRSFTHREEKLVLPMPYVEAFECCIGAVHYLKATIRAKDSKAGHIVARTGVSWKTWGDVIEMEVQSVDDSWTNVSISVSQVMKTTIGDWGRNRELLQRLKQDLMAGNP